MRAFERSLRTAGIGRLLLVTGVFVVISVFTVGLVIVGIVGTLESLNAFFHPSR